MLKFLQIKILIALIEFIDLNLYILANYPLTNFVQVLSFFGPSSIYVIRKKIKLYLIISLEDNFSSGLHLSPCV